MKEGTRYASLFKKAFAKLRQGMAVPTVPAPDDPVHRLAVAILGEDEGDAAGRRALDRVFSIMLDWNELRVSNPDEVHRAAGTASRESCERLVRALRAIYLRENRVGLDRLKSLGRREARHYLETLDGVDDYAAASVVLWSLNGHAVPVNDRVLGALRAAELVHPEASRAEVQAFLERHVSAPDAKETCLILQSWGGTERTNSRPQAHARPVKADRKPRVKK
jgi:endonuclease III